MRERTATGILMVAQASAPVQRGRGSGREAWETEGQETGGDREITDECS